MKLARTVQEYESLSPLCRFMNDLLIAGMDVQSVITRGYDFAEWEAEHPLMSEAQVRATDDQLTGERSPTEYMSLAARHLREASVQLKISLFAYEEKGGIRNQ